MQIFIHCKTTLHVSGVTAPIIRSIKNRTRSLRYRSYYLYRRLRVQFLILLMMGAVTPLTCRVVLQWINICILLHQLDFYSHWITMHGTTNLKCIRLLSTKSFGRFRHSSGGSHDMLLKTNTDINEHNGMTTQKFGEIYCGPLPLLCPLCSFISLFLFLGFLYELKQSMHTIAYLLPKLSNWSVGRILWCSVQNGTDPVSGNNLPAIKHMHKERSSS